MQQMVEITNLCEATIVLFSLAYYATLMLLTTTTSTTALRDFPKPQKVLEDPLMPESHKSWPNSSPQNLEIRPLGDFEKIACFCVAMAETQLGEAKSG